MKKTLYAFLIFSGAFASAEITSNFAATTDYVWRGISQTLHAPAIQGGLDYSHSSGISFGTWMSNVLIQPKTGSAINLLETDLYGAYSYSFSESFSASIGATAYTYSPKYGFQDTFEYNLGFDFMMFNLSANFTDNYFASKSDSWYYNLTGKFYLIKEEGLGVKLSVGQTTFGDEAKVGFKNYMDYKVALFRKAEKFTIWMMFIDTNRKDTSDVDLKDRSMEFMISREF